MFPCAFSKFVLIMVDLAKNLSLLWVSKLMIFRFLVLEGRRKLNIIFVEKHLPFANLLPDPEVINGGFSGI